MELYHACTEATPFFTACCIHPCFLPHYPPRFGDDEKSESFHYTTHTTNEHIKVIYKKGEDYNPQVFEKINYIFRDHRATTVILTNLKSTVRAIILIMTRVHIASGNINYF